MTVLPVDRVAWRVSECHLLAHCFGQHRGVVLFADDVVPELILLKQRRGEVVVAKTAPSLPIHGLCYPTGIFAVDDLLEPRNDESMTVVTEFDHDPAAAHL